MLDDHVPQVLVGLADVHSLDGLSCLTGVLIKRKKRNQNQSKTKTHRQGGECDSESTHIVSKHGFICFWFPHHSKTSYLEVNPEIGAPRLACWKDKHTHTNEQMYHCSVLTRVSRHRRSCSDLSCGYFHVLSKGVLSSHHSQHNQA